MRKKREIETEWELLGGSKKANSADPIDLLGDLRFKTQMGGMDLSREERAAISGERNAWLGKFRREKPITNMANPPGKLELGKLKITGPCCEFHMWICPMANP